MSRFALVFLVFIASSAFAQDSLSTRNEIGVALNRYLPDLDNENLPYFFGAEYRRMFKQGTKYDHFVFVRASGNYNRPSNTKTPVSKLFLAGEIGYHAKVRKDSSKWIWSWGVSAGLFNVGETVLPKVVNLYTSVQPESYKRSYFKIGVSPRFGVEYALTDQTFIQLFFSIGFGTRYFGSTDHLETNSSRGFSAQFPSLGIYQKF